MDERIPPEATSASASPVRRVVELGERSELRIEVGETPFKLQLVRRMAEIFGTELRLDIWLNFPPRSKFAVFTWRGAMIGVQGRSEFEYTESETPMVSYVNVNVVLTKQRIHARKSVSEDYKSSQGPRVIVVGSKNSGRSTLSRMLVSWAANLQWITTLVDLNIDKGSISIPGCIAAKVIEFPIDPEEGVSQDLLIKKQTQGTKNLEEHASLVYFFGHTNPGENVELYKVLVKELARVVERSFSADVEYRTAGMVINTMGWIEGEGLKLLLHVIEAFNADVVLVLGQDKLFSMLRNELGSRPNVDVVNLKKSGGVVSSSKEARKKARKDRIREYFYGVKNNDNPGTFVAKFHDLCVYRIAGGPQATSSALQIGEQPVANPLRVIPVDFGPESVHQVLAISRAEEPDQIITCCVAGFINIIGVDMDSKKIAYLSPRRGKLPSKILIMGSLAWIDEEH